MLKLEQAEKMIQLHIAMAESFDETQVRQICDSLSKSDYDNLPGVDIRDKIRELILQSSRRGRLTELVHACHQMRSDFHWEDRSAVFEATEAAKHMNSQRLVETLATRFSLDDLQQLAFYMGTDFEEVEALWEMFGRNRKVEPSERWLHSVGIVPGSMTPEELVFLFKETWARNFVEDCKRSNIWNKTLAACLHLHSLAFQ
jgi:hypothetical protein